MKKKQNTKVLLNDLPKEPIENSVCSNNLPHEISMQKKAPLHRTTYMAASISTMLIQSNSVQSCWA